MAVPIALKVGGFAVAIMAGYAWFANSIPQIESKPPQELSLEGGNVTPAQLVKAGEEIYHTKGTCEICHRIGQKGTRAPDLAGVGARAAKTKPGTSAKAYIIESLIHPQAHVVEGYPPIMPAVDKPPIALNRSEVWALTAFLESLGGSVTVTAERLEDAIQVSVSDTGIGIAASDHEAVFEEFRQVGSDYTKKAQGTGLGLALTRKFVELHGGRIWVASEPGKGATFTFTLPVARVAAVAMAG